jgi:gliding motility-associated-like protein
MSKMLSFKKISGTAALILLGLGITNVAKAAFTIQTNYTNRNGTLLVSQPVGPNYVTFNVQNNNPYAVALTNLSQYHDSFTQFNTAHSNNGDSYSLIYTTSNTTGQPNPLNWTIVAASAPIVSTNGNGVKPILSNLNVVIPPGANYRFAVVCNTSGSGIVAGIAAIINPAPTPPTPILLTPSTFTGNGVTIFATKQVDQYFGAYPGFGTFDVQWDHGWIGDATFERAGPSVAITGNNICEGGTITLTATAVGTTGATYTWYRPNGTIVPGVTGSTLTLSNVTPADAGNYKVSYTENGESSTQTIAVVSVSPAPPAPGISGKMEYCSGEQFQALNVIGQNILWYTSPVGGTAVNIPPYVNTNVPGRYTFYATQTVNGCESKTRTPVSITVAPKPAKPGVTTPVGYCENDTPLQLTADGDSLIWYYQPTGGLPSANAPVPNTTVRDTVAYYVSQKVDGCESDRAEIEVMVTFRPNGLILVSRDPEICAGDTLSFGYYGSGLPTTAYNWNIPPTGVEYISGMGTAGPFTVRFLEAGNPSIGLNVGQVGCYSELYSKPIEVKAIPTASIAAKTNICQNATEIISLYSYTPTIDSFIWDWDGGTPIHYATDQGPYGVKWTQAGTKTISLIVTDRLCRDTLTDTVIIHGAPDAGIVGYNPGVDVNICVGDSLLLQANTIKPASSYVWSPARFFDGYDNIPVTYARIDYNDYITLEVTDEYGCKNADSILVKMKTEGCCVLTLPSAFTPNGDGKNDKFRILSAGLHGVSTFRVMNRWGQTVFETADQETGWDGNMNGKPQDIGTYLYFVRFKCNGRYTEQKGEVTLIR